MNFNMVLCAGDSLVHGARDEYGSAFPFEMGAYLTQRVGGTWLCIEKGVNGETSSELMRRFYDVVRAYPEAYEVCLLTGTNDAKDEIVTPTDHYEMNLLYCYQVCQVLKRKLFIGLLPGRSNVVAPPYGVEFDSQIAAYNEVIERMAKRKGLWAVDLSGLKADCFADGLHFSHLGNHEVARRFGDGLIAVREGKVPSDQYQTGILKPARSIEPALANPIP